LSNIELFSAEDPRNNWPKNFQLFVYDSSIGLVDDDPNLVNEMFVELLQNGCSERYALARVKHYIRTASPEYYKPFVTTTGYRSEGIWYKGFITAEVSTNREAVKLAKIYLHSFNSWFRQIVKEFQNEAY